MESKASKTGPKYAVEEYWLIRDDLVDEFATYYRSTFGPIMERIRGFQGWQFRTPLADGQAQPSFGRDYLTVGPPEHLIVDHPGMQLDGVKTDKSINLHALLRNEYNLITVIYLADDEALREVLPTLERLWTDTHHTSVYADPELQKRFFGAAINHWDVIHRILT